MKTQPSLFVSHAAPTAALADDIYTRSWQTFGKSLGQPSVVVVMSAHGMSKPDTIRITSSARPSLIYDFSGFPDELYKIKYPCPGSPEMALNIREKLLPLDMKVELNDQIGIDHGVWVPLLHMFPKADIPVVQVSMPYPNSPERILAVGRALSPLRAEGALLIGSGGAVHNLRALNWQGGATAAWAQEFNEWLKNAVEENHTDEIVNFNKVLSAKMAHPSPDHLYPIFFTLGARNQTDVTETIVEGFQYSTLSLYSFLLKAQ